VTRAVPTGPEEDDDPEGLDPVVGPSKPRLLNVLGPGLITGASDDDPSGIATYSQAGAQFGYALSWTMLFSYPLMSAVQMISARIGRTTGHGIAGVLRLHYSNWLLQGIVVLLLLANTINLGADLGAMADAVNLLVPGPRWPLILLFAGVCIYMQVFLQYARYVAVLKWLTLALFGYFAVLVTAKVDWGRLAVDVVLPRPGLDAASLTTIVAILGTTISPYLFFWQSAEEVEDLHAHPRRQDLFDAPEQGPAALRRIEVDTVVGMGLSNIVALAIMATTAATLHANGITDIQTSADAAQALRPIAGDLAFVVFAIGIVGTGLLAVPVLAGSAAYALGEARRWPTGFSRRWAGGEGLLRHRRARDARRDGDELHRHQPHQGALLERRHQRRRRRARHGDHDADRGAGGHHGPLRHPWLAALARLGCDGRDGRCRHRHDRDLVLSLPAGRSPRMRGGRAHGPAPGTAP
jgi:NRAMP (natural resistance-associated macrophage protein)-like metal ion transporter